MIGIFFAFGALVGWGFGDFWIQRTARCVGVVRTLLYIGAFGSFFLFPFIVHDALRIITNPHEWPFILLINLIVIFAAWANFTGLKQGKLALVMPVTGLELVIAVLAAMIFFQERYPPSVLICIFCAIIGILFMAVKKLQIKSWFPYWEKGFFYAVLGAVGLGLTNILVGSGSR